jgi:hypothetical protein
MLTKNDEQARDAKEIRAERVPEIMEAKLRAVLPLDREAEMGRPAPIFALLRLRLYIPRTPLRDSDAFSIVRSRKPEGLSLLPEVLVQFTGRR